jgi:hypothetical protein
VSAQSDLWHTGTTTPQGGVQCCQHLANAIGPIDQKILPPEKLFGRTRHFLKDAIICVSLKVPDVKKVEKLSKPKIDPEI